MVNNTKIKKLALACSVLSIGLVFNIPAKAESVTVYAAASLTNAINDLEKIYEKQNKDTKSLYNILHTYVKENKNFISKEDFITSLNSLKP